MVDHQVQPRASRITAERLPSTVIAFLVAAYRVQQSLCFYLWVTDVHVSRSERFSSPDRSRGAESPTIPRRRRINLIDPVSAVSDKVAVMNGSSSDSDASHSSRRKGGRYDFRIGKTDRFAWEQLIVPKLNSKYTDAPGDDPINGAAAVK